MISEGLKQYRTLRYDACCTSSQQLMISNREPSFILAASTLAGVVSASIHPTVSQFPFAVAKSCERWSNGRGDIECHYHDQFTQTCHSRLRGTADVVQMNRCGRQGSSTIAVRFNDTLSFLDGERFARSRSSCSDVACAHRYPISSHPL